MGKEIRLAADDIITDEDFASLAEWIASKPRLSQGPEVKAFEEEWAAWLGVRHAVFCNSGSSANLLAYAALFESDGRKQHVAAPAVAWPTTIAPAVQYGASITLLDADPQSWGMDMNRLEDLCRESTPHIVAVVDVLGIPADRDKLTALRDRYGFTLIEDCCGAHGATWRGQKVGTFGDLSTFSFFIGHHMTTGEGGMVCTNDDRLNRVLRQLRAHGWAVDLSPNEQAALAAADDVDAFRERFTFRMTGFNLRNTEFAAKLGRMQLKRLDAVIEERQNIGAQYRATFDGPSLVTFPYSSLGKSSPIAFAILTKSKSHRDGVSRSLTEAGVEHRAVGGGNMARQPFLRGYPKLATTGSLSKADEIHDRAIQVPCHPGMSSKDVERVCSVIL